MEHFLNKISRLFLCFVLKVFWTCITFCPVHKRDLTSTTSLLQLERVKKLAYIYISHNYKGNCVSQALGLCVHTRLLSLPLIIHRNTGMLVTIIIHRNAGMFRAISKEVGIIELRFIFFPDSEKERSDERNKHKFRFFSLQLVN